MDNPVQTNPVNPLLERLRIPGATYRLPSQGLFYKDGVLDPSVKNGEVEVYPMTAIDEIILSTPDKLLSGKAIIEVFSRCIPQVISPGDLLSKDVDYLMTCLRLVSFGPTMTVGFQHDCENAKEHDYEIDLAALVKTAKQVDPTLISKEYVTLMENGQRVVLKPLTYLNIIELYRTTVFTKMDELSVEETSELIIKTMTSIIKSVDDIENRDQISEWVSQIPLGWKRAIEKSAQDVSEWGVNFMVDKKCQDCGEVMKVQVTANPVSFFT